MARYRKKRKFKLISFLVLIFTAVLVVFVCNQTLLQKNVENSTLSNNELAKISIFPDSLYSPYAILLSPNDHTVLLQKNSEAKIYPASLTKIMTVIIAIDDLPNLQEKINLPDAVFRELDNSDASMTGFEPNEKVTAIDLLYGAMLPSGAESCLGLADRVAGSEQNFVKMMNNKAAELGMTDTHFANVTGLYDENHYTTVKDLAILLTYAIQNKTFREIFTSASHATQPTNKHPFGITFYSTMFEKLHNPNVIGGKILGGKTGYTKEAGLCLASLAQIGGKEYILVTAGAQGNHSTQQYNIVDALTVYNRLGKQ